jgi:chromatin remodeling complex protein RSC6
MSWLQDNRAREKQTSDESKEEKPERKPKKVTKKKSNRRTILALTILTFVISVLIFSVFGAMNPPHYYSTTVTTTVTLSGKMTTVIGYTTITQTTITLQATKIIYVTTNSTNSTG